jgi:dipeptidyl aminopeptidase/acylaminoacyl peptidase
VVRDVRWSPDGFRIAYRHDHALAVIAGDGTAPRVLASPVRAVAPAWRPGAPHTLAWVDAHGRVAVADVDVGIAVWGSAAPVGRHVRELLWSADGRRLIARGRSRLVVLDVRANRDWRMWVPRSAGFDAAAWAPRGPRLALAMRVGTTTRLDVLGPAGAAMAPRRSVLTVPGTLASLAWSPDGRTLVVRRREADQWLLVRADGRGRPTAIGSVSRRFGGVPTVRGWCCAG